MKTQMNQSKLRSKTRRSQRRGATAIEFAMMAPAFIAIMFVCGEFTRMSMMRNLAQNAAYEAARFVMTEGATIADGVEVANSILARVGTVGAVVTINGSDGSPGADGVVENELDAQTEMVTCRILITLKDNSLIIPESIIGDTVIEAAMTVRTERYRGFFDAADVGN